MQRFILTVGPALLHTVPLTEIHDPKYIYRINGAHGTPEEIRNTIHEIRAQVSDAEILMDLPGNKVRTRDIGELQLEEGKQVTIPSDHFNYPEFYQHLKPGMTAWANDSIFELEVVEANEKGITFLSKSTGILTNGKGVHVRGIHQDIPFLFEKDKQLIQLANEEKLNFVGLSFVRSEENVKEAKALLNPDIEVISKVETLDAVERLDKILPLVRYILVDRGDLSADVGIENIPRFQRFILEKALYYGVRVFLATQVLKNMEEKPVPTIAEIEALYSIYTSGVYGVQMSEETAVGHCIHECLDTLNRMCAAIEKETIVL